MIDIRRGRRPGRPAVLILAMCLFLAGCGKKQEAPEVFQVPDQPVLNLASFIPDTLNPVQTENEQVSEILNLVYEPLVHVDNKMNPMPILAKEWSVSNNCTVWKIQLRKDIRFHDGSTLRVQDVINSLNLARASARYSHVFNNVLSISEENGNLIIMLSRAVPNFVSLLEIPISKGDGVGTGPYKLADNSSNKFMQLVAFENWWNEDKPFIKEIMIRYMPDKNTFFFAYNAGEIDMVVASQSDLGKYNSNEKNASAFVPTNRFSFMGFNGARSSLFSHEFKQAINHALDKEKLAATIFSGRADFTNSFINPKFSMASPEFSASFFDAKKANEILKDYHGRRDFEIIVNSDNENRLNVAYFIANSLKEVGINASVRRMAWSDYEAAVKGGHYDAFVGEVLLANNSNVDFLFRDGNLFNYSSEETNSVIKSWQEQTTLAGIAGGYHFLEARVLEDLPFIGLYFETKSCLYNEKLTSKRGEFKPLPNNPYFDINYWYFK